MNVEEELRSIRFVPENFRSRPRKGTYVVRHGFGIV